MINTHVPESTGVSGEKTWEDDDNAAGARPENITVRLLADGSATQYAQTVTANRDGRWLYEFDKVPLTSGSGSDTVSLQYSLKQEKVDGYSWTASFIGRKQNGDTLEVDTKIVDVWKGEDKPSGDSSNTNTSQDRNTQNSTVNVNTGNSPDSGSSSSYSGGGGSAVSGGSSSGGGGSSYGGGSAISGNSSGGEALMLPSGDSGSGRSAVSTAASDAKTGDETNLALYICLMLLSLMVISALILKKRRRIR